MSCLLYTSDAADERSSVDLGGRRIIKKKTKINIEGSRTLEKTPLYKCRVNNDNEIKTDKNSIS